MKPTFPSGAETANAHFIPISPSLLTGHLFSSSRLHVCFSTSFVARGGQWHINGNDQMRLLRKVGDWLIWENHSLFPSSSPSSSLLLRMWTFCLVLNWPSWSHEVTRGRKPCEGGSHIQIKQKEKEPGTLVMRGSYHTNSVLSTSQLLYGESNLCLV